MDYISILAEFFKVHEFLAYIILFLGSYFETLIGPGFFIHGEFFFLPGGIIAGLGYLNIWLVYIICVFGGILGDNSSYYLGRKYGAKVCAFLFTRKNKYLNIKNLNKGREFFKRYGDKSVYFARLLGPVSWVTPFLAGIFKLKYSKFFKYNLLGVSVGIGQFVAAGYILGFSYLKIFAFIQKYFLLTILAIVLIIYIIRKIKNKGLISRKLERKLSPHFLKYGIYYTIGYIILYLSLMYLILI